MRADRRDIHDFASPRVVRLPLFQHPAAGLLAEEKRPLEIDRHECIPVLLRGLKNICAPDGGDAGIVDQEVKAAKLHASKLDQPIAILRLANVRLTNLSPNRVPCLPGQLDTALGRALGSRPVSGVIDHQVPAGRGQLERDPAADPARCPRDECHLIHVQQS